MRWVIVVLLLALAGPAAAQQPAQWVRLSLNDGRFVDGYITGGDAAAYFVQTSYGLFSIQRTNVIAVTPMGAPATANAPPPSGSYAPPPSNYAPMPTPTAQPLAPPAEKDNGLPNMGARAGGLYLLGLSYGITVLAASAQVDNDKSAKAGYIPVVGPLIWALADEEDDAGEDGWDWLGAMGTLVQGSGAYLLITGGAKKTSKVNVTAVTTKHYGGFVVGGSF